jgi:signal transduction histidine kinase
MADRADVFVDATTDAELEGATLRLVAHDINNPLTAIRILAEMLRDDVDEVHRRDVTDILEAADLASAVVGSVSEARYQKDDEYTWFPLDLVQLLTSVVDRPALRRHVTLDMPRELQIGGDQTALRRAFTDLLVNGRRMVDGRQGLTVRTSEVASAVEVRVEHPRSAVIPTAMRHRIPVSAVGLVDAHTIIEGHGGTIHIEDADDGGMTVVVRLRR